MELYKFNKLRNMREYSFMNIYNYATKKYNRRRRCRIVTNCHKYKRISGGNINQGKIYGKRKYKLSFLFYIVYIQN